MTTKKTWLFLEWLRRSGQTNMYGATPYLMEEFWLNEEEAKEVLVNWMQNYNRDDYSEVIKPEDFE